MHRGGNQNDVEINGTIRSKVLMNLFYYDFDLDFIAQNLLFLKQQGGD